MRLSEREWILPRESGDRGLIARFARHAAERLDANECAVRFVVESTSETTYRASAGILECEEEAPAVPSIFEFRKRAFEKGDAFNVAFIIPTGMHAELGGHAGDAGPAARLLANACDTLVTHPNVVNGSDINEMTENTLYVEGSQVCRLLMGTIGLVKRRSNRVLFVIDKHEDPAYVNAAINAFNAARACYGLDGAKTLVLDPPVELVAEYSASGRATGRVSNLGEFIAAVAPHAAEFDALAISSVIRVPAHYHETYFKSGGEMVNPWGGVEAGFTHAISLLLGIPAAHSPMLESEEIDELDPGIVDPRMAAEAVSYTFLQCIFKGLMRSPAIITDRLVMDRPGVMTAADIACLVIPDGCLGLPVLAALEQGIKVIAVRDASRLMCNRLSELPWAPGQFEVVESYLEAAGALVALKAGLTFASVRRPLPPAPVVEIGEGSEEDEATAVGNNGAPHLADSRTY